MPVTCEEYAPYHKMPAFWRGAVDYDLGESAGATLLSEAEGQAYDRGQEYAMRVAREAAR